MKISEGWNWDTFSVFPSTFLLPCKSSALSCNFNDSQKCFLISSDITEHQIKRWYPSTPQCVLPVSWLRESIYAFPSFSWQTNLIHRECSEMWPADISMLHLNYSVNSRQERRCIFLCNYNLKAVSSCNLHSLFLAEVELFASFLFF